MIACIDTNVLLPMLSLRHPWGALIDAWIEGQFVWAVSNEILTEYEEIVRPRIGSARWQDFLTLLELGASLNENLLKVQPSFRFTVITADPDDNKFADCAITAHAEWVVTSDRHFKTLHDSGFKPQPITPEAFLQKVRP